MGFHAETSGNIRTIVDNIHIILGIQC